MSNITFFEDTHTVKRGETLTSIARAHGYRNPGPIAKYPGNRSKFPTRAAADRIYPGQKIQIPWTPDLLRKLSATSNALAVDVVHGTEALIKKEMRNKEDIESYFRKVDAICMIANIGRETATIVVEGAAPTAILTSQQIAHSMAGLAVGTTRESIPLVIHPPDAPKKDYRFFIRHTLGPWTPSFWVTTWQAFSGDEVDVDLYLYGADAIAYRNALKLKLQAEQDIGKLKTRVEAVQYQMNQPFYREKL